VPASVDVSPRGAASVDKDDEPAVYHVNERTAKEEAKLWRLSKKCAIVCCHVPLTCAVCAVEPKVEPPPVAAASTT
jgi:hypothetical protein